MTVVAVAVLVVGCAVGIAATYLVARGRGVGIAHPAVAWLLLTGVFFVPGSIVVAAEGRGGPAAYVGAAIAAFGLALFGSDAVARRRRDFVAGAPRVSSVRWPLVAGLALLGVALVVPTFVATGIPFLARDITASRTEIAGFVVLPLRVALPGAAALALLWATRPNRGSRRWLAAAAIVAIAAFDVLLASRYLLAELAAALVVAWLLAGRRIRPSVAAAVVVAGLVAFGGIQVLRAYDDAAGREVQFAATRTVNRVILVQPRTLAALMDTIPDEQPYFLGLTWVRRLGPLVGRDDIPNLGYWIYPKVVTGEQAVAGYAAPGWLGEAWANFGWAGIALFALLGVAVERLGALIAIRVHDRDRSPPVADIAASALLVLFVARTHALGVVGLGLIVVVVIAWRLVVGSDAGLGSDVRRTFAWRT
ncbi:MAG: hypothetical protein ACJ77B_02125 [Chloroflexota bacterium]